MEKLEDIIVLSTLFQKLLIPENYDWSHYLTIFFHLNMEITLRVDININHNNLEHTVIWK